MAGGFGLVVNDRKEILQLTANYFPISSVIG